MSRECREVRAALMGRLVVQVAEDLSAAMSAAVTLRDTAPSGSEDKKTLRAVTQDIEAALRCVVEVRQRLDL